MDDIATFFDEIYSWTTYSISVEGYPVDCITFWTLTNKIQIDWTFKRNKSIVYREELRDSAPFFSKDINYLSQLTKFHQYCDTKYSSYKEKQNVQSDQGVRDHRNSFAITIIITDWEHKNYLLLLWSDLS